MNNLKSKTVFVTGASRGIGLTIAKRAARDGANIVIAAKTEVEHPKLEGTIYSAAKELEALGAKVLPLKCDIRFEDDVKDAFDKAADKFGGIDILVNNASAISLTDTENTEMKRYDLMHSVNVRGTFLCSKYAIEYLRKSDNPHILNISPPLNMQSKWFSPHLAYTMAKYGMSMCTLGMSEELLKYGIAVNSLWPETAIATAAISNLFGGQKALERCRHPEIMADAAHIILTSSAKKCTGNFFIDSQVLSQNGFNDFKVYSVNADVWPMKDFFLN